MLEIDNELHDDFTCTFIFKTLPIYIQERLKREMMKKRTTLQLSEDVQKLEKGYKRMIVQNIKETQKERSKM